MAYKDTDKDLNLVLCIYDLLMRGRHIFKQQSWDFFEK